VETIAVILVAEDEETDAMLLRMSAEQAGLSQPIIFVADGKELVSYLQGDPPYANRLQHPLPAIILLDLKMPRMNGFEVLLWLSNRPALKHIPAIVLSSSCSLEDVARARALGASEYYTKPHLLSELTNIFKSLAARWLSKPAAVLPSSIPSLQPQPPPQGA
jgi:CheY-like chemotaxis protein